MLALPKLRSHTIATTVLGIVVVGLGLGGCGPTVSMWTQRPNASLPGFERSALNTYRPSRITRNALRGSSSNTRYHVDELGPLRRLRNRSDLAPRIRHLATSELAYLTAKRVEPRLPHLAERLYLEAAAQAYTALTRQSIDGETAASAQERAFTETLYNFSVSRFVKLRHTSGSFCSGTRTIKTPSNSYALHVATLAHSDGGPESTAQGEHGGVWGPCYFDKFLPANEVRFDGLRGRSVARGIGGALVGIRERSAQRLRDDPNFPVHGKIYPVTAVIRFADEHYSEATPRSAELTFYDPMVDDTTTLGTATVPLYSDFTAPLGVLFARDAPQLLDLPALLNPAEYMYRAGFQLLEPYRRDKIPVIFVHGLYSSPMTWRQVANQLLADREIRNNFQFWFYVYPSGLPTPYSAALLREQLSQLLAYLDPDTSNRGTNNIVYVGHSMGGLLGRLLLHDSGDEIWNEVFEQPIDVLDLREDDRVLLRRVFFFERVEAIKRIILIATPNRGAKLARSLLGQLISALVSLPVGLINLAEQILERNDEALTSAGREFAEHVPTGVDTLSPASPFIRALAQHPITGGVHYHSIIGVYDDSSETPSDGVVPYSSAHLDGADSELIVKAFHDAHQHLEAIVEIRRILHEHLEGELQPHSIAVPSH